MSDFLTGSICLSDIPKEFITNHANGKKYLNIVIGSRKEVGRFGETHNIMVSVPKDQRRDGDKPIYIGNAKSFNKVSGGSPQEAKQATNKEEEEMPF